MLRKGRWPWLVFVRKKIFKIPITKFAGNVDKELYITSGITHQMFDYSAFMIKFCFFIGLSVVCKGAGVPMPSSDHEEADTRMCVHIKDSLEKGARVISVRTVDTDVIIIIAAIFHQLRSTSPGVEIWVAFGVG